MNEENHECQKMNLINPSKEKKLKQLDFKNCICWAFLNVFWSDQLGGFWSEDRSPGNILNKSWISNHSWFFIRFLLEIEFACALKKTWYDFKNCRIVYKEKHSCSIELSKHKNGKSPIFLFVAQMLHFE